VTTLLAALAAAAISPADSCTARLDVLSIGPEALLYAELAAREGGGGTVLLARVLEAAGRFDEAASYYGVAAAGASDPSTLEWLGQRIRGMHPLDSVLVLSASIRNPGPCTVRGLEVTMALPEPHPPYQESTIILSSLSRSGDVLLGTVDSLPPGGEAVLPVVLRIVQVPYTYRPVPDPGGGVTARELAAMASSCEVPGEHRGQGPCLDMSEDLVRTLAGRGLESELTGGLVLRGDSLVFHAWVVLRDGLPGMPLDPLLFETDSLRAFAHCPCDVVPLWDLGPTGGHELRVSLAPRGATVELGLRAAFCPFDPSRMLAPLLSILPGGG
jgi:hypothetical protein